MSIYAKNTKVNFERSRAEIERNLARYGASSFAYMTDNNKALVMFALNNRRIKFVLPLPNPNDFKTRKDGRSKKIMQVSPDQAYKAYDQACRQSWRALALSIKAKLETVESGIATFEEEFLAYILLPGNKTFGGRFIPQIGEIYETGKVPQLEFKS